MEKIRPNINPQSWEAFPAGELQRQYDREDRGTPHLLGIYEPIY